MQKTMSEEDPQQIKELRFIFHEKVPSPFGLPVETTPDLDCRFEFVEPNALVRSSARSEGRFGLIKFRMNGTFLLADYKSRKESGTVLIDSTSFIGPRAWVTQLFLAKASPAHRKMLDNLREFFVKKQQR